MLFYLIILRSMSKWKIKKLMFFQFIFLMTSCGYHVEELKGEFNSTGSTTTEIFQYAVTIGILVLIFWLIGKRNQRNKNR